MALSEKPEPLHEGNMPRPYDDVRQWLELVENMGELKRVNGADWNLEIGTMAELIYRERSGDIPALLFDRIKGYSEGFRILFASKLPIVASRSWPACRGQRGTEARRRFKEKLNKLQPIAAHRGIRTGLKNTMSDDAVTAQFPVPKVHELDGGPFIGTACIAIAAIRRRWAQPRHLSRHGA